MLPCFVTDQTVDARPLWALSATDYPAWRDRQDAAIGAWLDSAGFEPRPTSTALIPGPTGAAAGAVLILSDPPEPWDLAIARGRLPGGFWRLAEHNDGLSPELAALGWGLASYQFDRYRQRERPQLQLVVADDLAIVRANAVVEAVTLARDLINTPASDLGPAELAAAIGEVGARFGAAIAIIEGDDLLDQNYPAIHAVGHGSARGPRMIDLRWGDPTAPRVTLVGKGVCFDTGGLDLKPANNMRLMKKDMGGAAVTLGLAQAIMAADLPVRLRLLVGAVENSVSGTAFRPGDVLRTRKGLTVEIGNTDAEGRLVLADLLAEGDRERPDLMLDCATLTGAARVALGPDLPALFTPDDELAATLLAAGQQAFEPLWRLPLHAPYRELIESPIADLDNAGKGGFAGAVTAALFLDAFVTETRSWAHLDVFGWNPEARPGRPKGGEATALRALLAGIENRYAN